MSSQISFPDQSNRLASLDMLRGFDLFMLVFFQPVFNSIAQHWANVPIVGFFLNQLNHVSWEGFHAWDLVMPLFLFMVGAAMPFSFEKFKNDSNKKAIYKRIIRRVIILFILGMVVQGNLLSLDPLQFKFYSNTLQSIAIGYFIAAIFQLHLSNLNQYIVTGLLLFTYWALLTFLGDFTPTGNIADKIDRFILGPYRDGAYYLENGTWEFSSNYYYTWILSSMTFGVTVMLGSFAGKLMKNGKDRFKNSRNLLVLGIGLLASGWLLSFQTPIIKPIWSSSMTLFAGGLSFLLMAFFYYFADYKGKFKNLEWLKFYGMNSITAYCLGEVVNFRSIAISVLWGLEKYTGDFYPSILTFANFLILFFILKAMYKAKIFIKI